MDSMEQMSKSSYLIYFGFTIKIIYLNMDPMG